MKNKFFTIIFGILLPFSAIAQTQIMIPDTVSGSSIDLVIQNGTKQFYPNINTNTIGYNGNYLGKTIILQKGQTVTLNVQNQLSEVSTTHWHGLHVTPMNDGSPHNPIAAGAKWSPSFTVMDNAATYWYHPHLHGKTMKQVVKGAAGLIIVKDNEEARLNLPRNYGVDDIPLIFQFQTFNDATKQIVDDNDEFDNAVLVNGTLNGFVNCPAQIVRLRLLNASSHRVFRFGFDNNQAFYQIGSDDGLLNTPLSMTRLNLGSGERAEILVNLSALQGTTLNLKTYGTELPSGYPGGPAMMGMQTGPLDNTNFNVLQIKVTAPTQNPVTAIPTTLTNNVVWSQTSTTTRSLDITAQPMMSMTNFFLNGNQYNENTINFTTTEGKTEIWTITNQTMMAHPFHIHGNHFYVLQVNGSTPPANMQGRKDVVIIPPMGGSVKLITKYEHFSDPNMPYMYHCHILSHEDGGMMGQFIVNQGITATHEIELNAQVQISPNPAISSFQLKALLPETEPVEVSVFDVLGRQMTTQSFNKVSTIDLTIPCATWANGFYTVKIAQNGKAKTVKFLKQ
jgi:bilirubin oxidase